MRKRRTVGDGVEVSEEGESHEGGLGSLGETHLLLDLWGARTSGRLSNDRVRRGRSDDGLDDLLGLDLELLNSLGELLDDRLVLFLLLGSGGGSGSSSVVNLGPSDGLLLSEHRHGHGSGDKELGLDGSVCLALRALASEPERLLVGERRDEERGQDNVVVADAEVEEGRGRGLGRSEGSSKVDGRVHHAADQRR